VDENIEIEGVTEKGNVITFSTSEAMANGFCEAKVDGIDEIMERNEIKEYELIPFTLDPAETIISFFLNPFISGILIMIIIGGVYFELQTPGVGFPILAAGIALILYLVPYYLNGLAESWEIVAFITGIVLIGLEIFVIPGFGIAGVSGIILSMGSLILMMLNNDLFDFSFVPMENVFVAVVTTLGAMLGSVILMFFGGVKLANSEAFNRVALTKSQDRSEGFTSSFNTEEVIGKTGTAYTVLRPSGKVLIEEELYDAYTRGGFIDKGEDIVVISTEGTSLKVKKKD